MFGGGHWCPVVVVPGGPMPTEIMLVKIVTNIQMIISKDIAFISVSVFLQQNGNMLAFGHLTYKRDAYGQTYIHT